MLFLQQSSGNKKYKKTQQSATKMEAAGTIGCWKIVRMFQG
jgi:hypothetical protein